MQLNLDVKDALYKSMKRESILLRLISDGRIAEVLEKNRKQLKIKTIVGRNCRNNGQMNETESYKKQNRNVHNDCFTACTNGSEWR